MRKIYPVTAKWIYIYSVFGCSIISTNDNISFSIPAGFFALNREEIEQYFTNNYVTFDVNDSDSSFTFFCYDFAINSVQPLSDSVTPLLLSKLSSIEQYIISMENLARISQNNTSICANVIQQFLVNYNENNSKTTNVDLGSVFAVLENGAFNVYIPKGMKMFNGTIVIDLDLNDSSLHSADSGFVAFDGIAGLGFLFDGLSSDLNQRKIYLNGVHPFDSFSFPVRVYGTDSTEYSVTLGSMISSYSLYGTIACKYLQYFYCVDVSSYINEFDVSRLYSCSLTGRNIVISPFDTSYNFQIIRNAYLDNVNLNNWGCKFHFEIPFSYVS